MPETSKNDQTPVVPEGTKANLDKAGILMLTLENSSPGITAKVMSALGEQKAKILLERISTIGKVSNERRNEAISDFYSIALEKQFVFGGMDVSSKILKESFGINKAKEFFKNKKEKFRFLDDVDVGEMNEFLQKETDQMKVFIYNFLSPEKASELIAAMDDDSFAMKIMNNIEIPNMDLMYDFEIELASYFNALSEDATQKSGSEHLQKLATTLEYLPDDRRKHILEQYFSVNEDFASRLRALIFTFEDFQNISDQIFQTILFEISDFRQIAIAKLGASPELAQKINLCLTERTKSIVDSESLGLEKKVNIDQIEEAKRKIISLARKMEQKGEVTLKHEQ